MQKELRVKQISILILASTLLFGCVNPINQNTSRNYYEQGERALQRGNLAVAKEMFSRSLVNARLGGASPSDEAVLQLKLARINGNMCLHNEAEKLFIAAIENLKKDNDGPGYTFVPRVEYSQYLFDIGKYGKAIPKYKVIISEAKQLFGEKDPMSVAALYDDLAFAYEKVGDNANSKLAMQESLEIQKNNTGFTTSKIIKSRDNYKPYPKTC